MDFLINLLELDNKSSLYSKFNYYRTKRAAKYNRRDPLRVTQYNYIYLTKLKHLGNDCYLWQGNLFLKALY